MRAVLAHRCLHDDAPSHLSDAARTRSSLGHRAFAVAAPRACNKLPLELRATVFTASFKKNLNLFNLLLLLALTYYIVRRRLVVCFHTCVAGLLIS